MSFSGAGAGGDRERPLGLSLEDPGILFAMVASDDGDVGGVAGVAGDDVGGTRRAPGSGSRAAALVVVASLATAAGALLQAGAQARFEGLARGEQVPGAAWFEACTVWLPGAVFGAALGASLRLSLTAARVARASALVALGVAAVACAQGASHGAPALIAAVALGLAGGLHVASLRLLGRAGALFGGTLAVIAALMTSRLGSPVEGFAVGFAAVSVGLALDAPRSAVVRVTRRSAFEALGSLLLFGASVAGAASLGAPPVAALAALVAIGGCASACGRPGMALGAALGVAVAPLALSSAVGSIPRDLELARHGRASVVYVRSNQQMEVRVGDQVLAAAGPDRDEEPLLAALAHVFGRPGDVVTLLGRGTGRVGATLRAAGRFVVEVADPWPSLVPLTARASADGPVAPPRASVLPCAAPGGPRLAERDEGSRQLLCVCELPVPTTGHRATVPFQRALRRVVGDGLVLQAVALDRVEAALFERLLAAARQAHPWTGLYRVGDAVVLVSGSERPAVDPASVADLEVAWALHRAHLGGAGDIARAFAGELIAGVRAVGPAASASDLLELSLRRAAPSGPDDGLLRWWSCRQRDLDATFAQLQALSDDAAGRSAARQIGLRFVACGAPRPWLQAALGLAGADGVALQDPRLQSRCAHALDPTFFAARPAVLDSLPTPTAQLGDLEDEHVVAVSERLARRCSGENPLAVALRARYPSRCARALVEALERGPLGSDEALALRELSDPFVVHAIARALLPAGRWTELLMFWSKDLPLPHGLRAATAQLDASGRRRVGLALQTHADPSCQPLLADLMVDQDREVRGLAASALRATLGERVAYDPQWPPSKRLDAASRLLELHNRRP